MEFVEIGNGSANGRLWSLWCKCEISRDPGAAPAQMKLYPRGDDSLYMGM